MSVIAKFGFRHYEFENASDFSAARTLWVRSGSQNDFEDAMDEAGIEFVYHFLTEENENILLHYPKTPVK